MLLPHLRSTIAGALLAAMLAAAIAPASAGSTINPSVPAQGSPLTSAPVRGNFGAAFNDINNILGMFAGPTAPAGPTQGQDWLNTSTLTAAVWNKWSASSNTWVPIGTFNLTTGTFQPGAGGVQQFTAIGVGISPGSSGILLGNTSPPTPTGSNQGAIGATSAGGLVVAGQGTVSDFTLENKNGTQICSLPTGTTMLSCAGITATTINSATVTAEGAAGSQSFYFGASQSLNAGNTSSIFWGDHAGASCTGCTQAEIGGYFAESSATSNIGDVVFGFLAGQDINNPGIQTWNVILGHSACQLCTGIGSSVVVGRAASHSEGNANEIVTVGHGADFNGVNNADITAVGDTASGQALTGDTIPSPFPNSGTKVYPFNGDSYLACLGVECGKANTTTLTNAGSFCIGDWCRIVNKVSVGVLGNGLTALDTSGALWSYTNPATNSLDSNQTITAAQACGGMLIRSGISTGRTDTFDTAANIVAGTNCPGQYAETAMSRIVRIFNQSSFVETIAASASGGTLSGSGSVSPGTEADFLLQITNTTPTSEAYTITRANTIEGTAATFNAGTSGGNVPVMNGSNTWSGTQTYNSGNLILAGSSSGTTILNAAATAGSTTATLPDNTGTIAELNLSQGWSAHQSISYANALFSIADTGTSYSYMTIEGDSRLLTVGHEGSVNAQLCAGDLANYAVICENGSLGIQFGTNNTVVGTWFASGGLAIGSTSDPGTNSLRVAGLTSVATTSAVCYNTSSGLLTYDGTLGTCNTSDERLKKFEGPLRDPMTSLIALSRDSHFGYFKWRDSEAYGGGRRIGMGAQTAARYFPELTETGEDGYMSLAYDKLTVPIIAAIAQLKADNDSLRAEIERIRRRASR